MLLVVLVVCWCCVVMLIGCDVLVICDMFVEIGVLFVDYVMFEGVVYVVVDLVELGDVVLLLFVCVSFDMFRNYVYCVEVFCVVVDEIVIDKGVML